MTPRNGTIAPASGSLVHVAETLQQVRGRHGVSPRVAQMLAVVLLHAARIDAASVGQLELHFGPNGVSAQLNQRLLLDDETSPR